MRNLRNLVQDYVDHMGYNGHEEVNRIMLVVYQKKKQSIMVSLIYKLLIIAVTF